MSQSVADSNQAGDVAVNARAAALGSRDLAVPYAAHTTATNLGHHPICTVRTAGPATAPAAYLVANSDSNNLAAAPYNMVGPAGGNANRFGFRQRTATPSGILSQLVVAGSDTPQRTSSGFYSGAVTGGSNVLSFAPSHPFFTGEKVTYTATSSVTAQTGGKHPTPFRG